jgi:hypothetical protein
MRSATLDLGDKAQAFAHHLCVLNTLYPGLWLRQTTMKDATSWLDVGHAVSFLSNTFEQPLPVACAGPPAALATL